MEAKKRKSLWGRILIFSLLGLVALLLLLFTGAAILLTPKRLTPIAERLIDGLFVADVHFDTLKVSLFQEFPYINLTVVNGRVRTRVFDSLPQEQREMLPAGCDSLLRFKELSMSLHVPKILKSQIDIRRIRLSRAEINAYQSPYGIANWDVYLSDTTVTDSSEVNIFQLNLQRIILRDQCRLSYRSDPDSISASLQFDRLFFRGDIGARIEDIKLETIAASGIEIAVDMASPNGELSSSIDSLRLTGSHGDRYALFLQSRHTLFMDHIQYADALPVAIRGEVGFSLSRLDSLFFKDFTISAARLPITLDGSLVMAHPQLRMQLECEIDTFSLAGIISMIPPSLVPELAEIDTDISAKISASVKWPAYTCQVTTYGGYLHYPSQNAYIHHLAIDATYTHRPDRPERSRIELRQCDVDATGISLHANGYVQNPSSDPDINLTLQGDILLDTLYRLLPISEQVTARGALSFDATAKLLLSDFLQGDLKTSTLRGRVDAERLLLRLPKDSILIMARGAHLNFGANQNQRDSVMEQGAQILRLSFRADSANIRYKQQFRLSMGNTRLSARSAASALDGDTTQIHPFTGSLQTNYLSYRSADTTQLLLETGACDFSFLPAPDDRSIPVITTKLKAHLFQMSDKENGCTLYDPFIYLQATHFRSMRDSLSTRNRQGRPSNRETDEFASEDFDLEIDNESKQLLRQWQFDGIIQANGGALSTPYFPLPITLGETDLEVSSEEIQLMQTEIRAGRSRIECTGKISNIRQALLGRRSLSVYGFIRSDTLDVNELMYAANAGAQYAQTGVVVAEIEEAGNLIIIPANLALDLKLFSDYTRYADEYLTDLSGGLTSRNRTLQINDLEASSPFGSFVLSAIYATRSRSNITAGFDLNMKNMQIERLIAMIPSVDTLAPMLRSFEGMVNCQVSATTAMDTEMNLLLPSLKAACRIQGQNMVLLDGETFTEISKMLYFKNKNRNLIDRISVDFLIHDNQVEVFPFIVEMDRYRAAVSGIHRLDMSFDYHISVLHSPIPFKLGINVTGTLDDLHYKLARCRYRDTNIPSYVELIDATRIDLLQAIKAFDPTAAMRSVDRSVDRAARIAIEEEEVEEEVE